MTKPRDAALVALYAGGLFAAGAVAGLALGAVVVVAIVPRRAGEKIFQEICKKYL